MLFNEPKLLKRVRVPARRPPPPRFSALQRAEIAEIGVVLPAAFAYFTCFSALQRAEIAEKNPSYRYPPGQRGFSALQRAEIAEIGQCSTRTRPTDTVSVLFNEPKLLKS